ncbi:hypothetical protein pZL12.111c [Streptomyces phage ZL12]|uniref:Uncharacterized protein n=1 Tax=Streptomyces phage ZL12 TaxID=2570911 RepID=D0UWL6_9CAUD|nr:hypothetical protein QEH43_gp111 [Streptomyces phage ZL12]ACX71188.1 hypothetical protein pZL12.111c [Streptomyces phage ZL12]
MTEASQSEGTATQPADPKQPAYDAVFAYIRSQPDVLPATVVERNAMIWRAVHAALAAAPPAPADRAATCICGHPTEWHDEWEGCVGPDGIGAVNSGDCACTRRPAAPAAPEETTPAPQCSAALLPATDEAVDRCVRHGAHDTHTTAAGVRWPNEDDPEL